MPHNPGKPGKMPSLTNTILLIEDDMDTRDLLVRVLSAEGFGVRLAANGWEGLLAVESPPDLILLDIMLPGMDGVSFLRSLRNTHGYERVPVVVVTALDIADIADRVKPFGVQQIISKGDNLLGQLKLRACVARWTGRRTRTTSICRRRGTSCGRISSCISKCSRGREPLLRLVELPPLVILGCLVHDEAALDQLRLGHFAEVLRLHDPFLERSPEFLQLLLVLW